MACVRGMTFPFRSVTEPNFISALSIIPKMSRNCEYTSPPAARSFSSAAERMCFFTLDQLAKKIILVLEVFVLQIALQHLFVQGGKFGLHKRERRRKPHI